MKNVLLYPVAALALLASGNALAQQSSVANINVTATVEAACADVTATDVDFGSQGNIGNTDDATSTITVDCDTGTQYSVAIDYGVAPLGTQRQVTNGNSGEFMDYDIFQPGGFTTPWGEGADALDGTGTGAADALVANFRLQRAAGKGFGVYTDLVTVTLSY
ncbi:MAG TPA: spore coat protein U domain-containing protein [Verrucomicrobiae bacterium]|nr:spore coat protein U domain-containing protein [Verrucomicrobiae bacterium]